jgi:hypothetical protein
VLAELVVADEDQTLKAAQIKHHYKLAYAASFAAAPALGKKAVLATADADFEKIGKALKLIKLPQHLLRARVTCWRSCTFPQVLQARLNQNSKFANQKFFTHSDV